jgi:hypothetical protein
MGWKDSRHSKEAARGLSDSADPAESIGADLRFAAFRPLILVAFGPGIVRQKRVRLAFG